MKSVINLTLVVCILCMISSETTAEEFCDDFYGLFDTAFTFKSKHYLKRVNHYFLADVKAYPKIVVTDQEVTKIDGWLNDSRIYSSKFYLNISNYFSYFNETDKQIVFGKTNLEGGTNLLNMSSVFEEMTPSMAIMLSSSNDNCVLFIDKQKSEHKTLSIDIKTRNINDCSNNSLVNQFVAKHSDKVFKILGALHPTNDSPILFFKSEDNRIESTRINLTNMEFIDWKSSVELCAQKDMVIALILILGGLFHLIIFVVIPCILMFRQNKIPVVNPSETSEIDTESIPTVQSSKVPN